VFGGLIFHPSSKRYIELASAKELIKQMKVQNISLKMVGVFVNANLDEMLTAAKELKLFALQLHGTETASDIAHLNQQLLAQDIKCEIWKAVSVDSQTGELGPRSAGASRYLFDSKTGPATNMGGAQFGGTGQAFDWQQLPLNADEKSRAMLAGGLNPDNASLARLQGFYGLDFNSGLESSPGIKDPVKIAKAFAALRRN
jgi:indole-3-glycerol phosphate synthase / phosphoribosylanthranilate isomerase